MARPISSTVTCSGQRAKPTVLIFVRYYLPGYKSGGPIRTIANLVAQLGGEYHFKIVTFDRDATDTTPYEGVRTNEWRQLGDCDVWYCSPERRSLGRIAWLAKATDHSVVYLNGFFDYAFTIPFLVLRFLRLIPSRHVILAPRGEFGAAALGLKSGRKRVYLAVAKRLGLLRSITWQASSELEAQDIRALLGAVATRVVVAPNLPALSGAAQALAQRPKPSRPLRVVFLSRISPMKNLVTALQVLSGVIVSVEFNVYGHVSDPTYWDTCLTLAKGLPPNVRLVYHGSVPNEQVPATLVEQDLFFLPTLGENYGHAIVEALQSGVPVLISDRTPWLDVEARGAGWVVPLDRVDRFREIVEAVAEMAPTDYAIHANAAAHYGQEISGRSALIEATRSMLAGVGDGGTQ